MIVQLRWLTAAVRFNDLETRAAFGFSDVEVDQEDEGEAIREAEEIFEELMDRDFFYPAPGSEGTHGAIVAAGCWLVGRETDGSPLLLPFEQTAWHALGIDHFEEVVLEDREVRR